MRIPYEQTCRMAVVYAEEAVEWIENGGPAVYDLGEAQFRLERALELVKRARCTSDDPNNHQGDTCPVHEVAS